ncbi:MAG: hypothetical protein RMN52_17405 [Anaerolineae bacterium]|nr:hypothetical protein [Candidatus Roseilinea sp.]MDW8451776.1 hypothetical protein [Anaerolineae bacterium]
MVRLVLVVVSSLFALANVVRAFLAVQQANRLPDLPVAAPAPYIMLMSAAWAIAFGVCAFGLARAHRWAPRVTIIVIVLYQANLWLNHLAFARSSEANARAGFGILLSALSIVAVGGAALWLDRRLAAHRAEMTRSDAHSSLTSDF